jgi:predicted nucleotidyltransferase
MSKEQIFKELLKNQAKIKGFGVNRIGLFGSYAQGSPTKRSDIDFLVEFNQKTFDNYMGLKLFLETRFKKSVDLVIADAIKPRLKTLILKQVKYAKGI